MCTEVHDGLYAVSSPTFVMSWPPPSSSSSSSRFTVTGAPQERSFPPPPPPPQVARGDLEVSARRGSVAGHLQQQQQQQRSSVGGGRGRGRGLTMSVTVPSFSNYHTTTNNSSIVRSPPTSRPSSSSSCENSVSARGAMFRQSLLREEGAATGAAVVDKERPFSPKSPRPPSRLLPVQHRRRRRLQGTDATGILLGLGSEGCINAWCLEC